MEYKMNTNNNSSNRTELCRLSWFLIEMDEGLRDGREPTGKLVYCIIHSVDLIDSDPNGMYLNRIVKFKLNNISMHGRIIMASDERGVVEQRLKQLLEEDEALMQVGREQFKYFLVQYNKGPNNIIHAIVKEKDICWPTGDLLSQQKVMIKDGKLQRLGNIIFSTEYEDIAQEELARMKNRCFEMSFDDVDHDTRVNSDLWLLVQYSCSPNDVIYAIISQKETIWHQENLYPDVVAYISDGVNVFQAIILRKTRDRSILDSELERIKELAFVNPILSNPKGLPLDHESLCARTSNSLDESEEEEEEELLNGSTNSNDVLEKLEQQMQKEAAMIANAFESIDRVRRTMERRLYVLNNP